MTDLDRPSYSTNNELIKLVVPARLSTFICFITPLFVILSIFIAVTIFSALLKPGLPIIGVIIFSLFFLFFLYMGVTSLLALLWTLFGKDRITVDEKGFRVDRVLFFCFSSAYYQKDKIFDIYVNSSDFVVNKISRGKNDFLSTFRVGTVHFHYDDKLQHIAGGMTDGEAKIFLDTLNMQNLNEEKN